MRDTLLLALRTTLCALTAELSWRRVVSRSRRCTEAVLAIVIAIGAGRLFGVTETWWGAICAFSLTGLAFKPALDLGVQQIAGAFCGTVIGVLLSRIAGLDVATLS
jgi:hypothetical protein